MTKKIDCRLKKNKKLSSCKKKISKHDFEKLLLRAGPEANGHVSDYVDDIAEKYNLTEDQKTEFSYRATDLC